MDIKLIATDMDGTLLDSNKKLPKDFESWVRSHPDKKVVIASGRQYYALIRDLEALKDNLIFIAENGGLVFDKDKVLYCDSLSEKNVRQCFEIFDRLEGVRPVICGKNSAYMINPSKSDLDNAGIYYARLKLIDSIDEAINEDTIVKLALYVYDNGAANILSEFDSLKKDVDVVISGTSWIDFANYSANKGNALLAIMKQYGVLRSETMAFGDYLNDYSLLEACDESYCMANGHPELKAIAKHIAKSNDEDGVMEVLRTL